VSTLDFMGVAPAEDVHIHRAKIAHPAPVGLDDMAYVILPDFTTTQRWGPCPWPQRGSQIPAEGDDCLILLDNTDAPWIVNWWPGTHVGVNPGDLAPGTNGQWMRTLGGVAVWDTLTSADLPSDIIDDSKVIATAAIRRYKTRAEITSVSSAHGVTGAEDLILASGASTVITLPLAASYPGKMITVKKTDGGITSVTVACSGSDKIEGQTTLVMSIQYQEYTFVSDGVSAWFIIGAGRALVDADVAVGAGLLGSKLRWSLSSAPPTSPITGDLWIYNGIAGIYWTFIYDSSETTYKWKFIGGAPAVSRNTTNGTFNSATYVDLTGATAPTITLPRGGDYRIEFGGQLISTATVTDILRMSPSIAGGTPLDNDSAVFGFPPDATGASKVVSVENQLTTTGRAANDVVKLQFKRVNAAASSAVQELRIRPVRVI
jgi:hypothetical protein